MADSQGGTMLPATLLRIPQELLLQILVLLPLDDQISIIKVCSTFRNLILHDPILRNTRYAVDSGYIQVIEPPDPSCLPNPRFSEPKAHKILEMNSTRPFSKLICTSKGDTITRYAYRRCYDGGLQQGMIAGRVYTNPSTQEEIEAEKDSVVIALTMDIYRFKIQDITACPFLDEPYLKPSIEGMTSTGLEEVIHVTDNEEDYIDVQFQVDVHRSIFLKGTRTPDPHGWEERLKITKNVTVRQLTAMILKIAFRKLEATGLKPDSTAENVIRLWRVRNHNKWLLSLLHYRTSPETRNMVWELDIASRLGHYRVSRRVV
ncbi:hypothetical protein TWF506_007335 [Arthrobotrys conoides]|uniref:F-box domain-containing protein n=1 Tax=Arthrobotrys conoides TaxID=74498 RepID=A0AAN8RZI1_9PEZI